MNEFLSLFDFLGYPAGKNLGESVYKYALEQKTPVSTRQVSTRTYTGKVMLYTRPFLREFFGNPAYKSIIDADGLARKAKIENYYTNSTTTL
jgi:hypothetical protein